MFFPRALASTDKYSYSERVNMLLFAHHQMEIKRFVEGILASDGFILYRASVISSITRCLEDCTAAVLVLPYILLV